MEYNPDSRRYTVETAPTTPLGQLDAAILGAVTGLDKLIDAVRALQTRLRMLAP